MNLLPLIINCPECGGIMSIKESKYNNNKFYGCSNYPICKKTVNIKQ